MLKWITVQHRNIFVSYKFNDLSVGRSRTVHDVHLGTGSYLRYLRAVLNNSYDFNYRGDEPDNDMSGYSKECIKSYLMSNMDHTSMTIVLISPNMVDYSRPEDEQWIPWELWYSLNDKDDRFVPSYANAMMAVVLPDKCGSYWYAFENNGPRKYRFRTESFFRILGENMYNRLGSNAGLYSSSMSQYDKRSYIPVQIWDDFIKDYDESIDLAYEIRSDIDKYDIRVPPIESAVFNPGI